MRNFTFLFVVGLLFTAFSLQAQTGLTGLYTFEDEGDLFKNYATEGLGNPMCEGVMKWLPDPPSNDEDDQPSIQGEDWNITDGVGDNIAIALNAHNWFKIWHGIPMNGGGDYVNEFTVIVDVRVADLGLIYSLFECNPTPSENGFTSEMELVDGTLGTVGKPGGPDGDDPLGFSTNVITVNEYHRITYAADLTEGIYLYVDGELWHSVEGDFTDGYPAPYGADDENNPGKAAIKVCGNNEKYPANDPARDNDKDVDLVAVYDRTLDADEVAALGYAGSWAGLPEKADLNNIMLYPNPVKNVLNVSGVKDARLDVLNLTGQIVESVQVESETTSIDVSHLNSGIYFVRVHDGRNSFTRKVIIE